MLAMVAAIQSPHALTPVGARTQYEQLLQQQFWECRAVLGRKRIHSTNNGHIILAPSHGRP
jgi:hypothetical protein